MEFIGYLALIGIGLILSLIGGGGSLLAVPILVYIFSLDIVIASSYSLFIVGTTSLVGALNQRDNRIDIHSGLLFSTCSALTIFTTRKWILPSIPDDLIFFDSVPITKRTLVLTVFALLAIASSLLVLMRQGRASSNHGNKRVTLLFPAGIITGVAVGFVGAGGGFLILPSLLFFARLPFKIAVGTTLLVIGINSLLGFLGDVMSHPINWIFLLLITGLATSGMLLGSHFNKRIPSQLLRLSFGWVMLIVALGILAAELF